MSGSGEGPAPVPAEAIITELVRRGVVEFSGRTAEAITLGLSDKRIVAIHLQKVREREAAKGVILDVDSAFRFGYGVAIGLAVEVIAKMAQGAAELQAVNGQEPPARGDG